jgi:transcriptional regulator with XRE-family HTH domain
MATKDSKSREILLSIGKAVQFWRKLDGHDQHSFSNELKTVRSYVARLESGHTGISFARIKKIAGILGISPYTILTGMPQMEEAAALLELYRDTDYAISKKELEALFSQRLEGKTLTRDYYLNILSFLRSDIYTRR